MDWLETKFARVLNRAQRVREQERGQRGPKVYSLPAPEVECSSKGKPRKPYEFGVKVSVAAPPQALQRRTVHHPFASTARQSL